MTVYLGLKKTDGSYIMQFNFNYFDAHPSKWMWKVLYWATIMLEKLYGKWCAISPQDWYQGQIHITIHKCIGN